MKDTDKTLCRIVLDVMQAHGVEEIVVSPGSRNAPILISASYRKDLKCHISTDERDAAFLALGLATVSQKPVALACTSGTALYNYAPAIAEAFYRKIPLVVVSADRPSPWIDQNDSQTLIQPGALEKIVKKSFDIPVGEDGKDAGWFADRVANEAMLLAVDGLPGPVHINLQFDAPLSGTIDNSPGNTRVIQAIKPTPFLSRKVIEAISLDLKGKKIWVVAGFMNPDDTLNRSIAQFSSLPGVVVICETLSNLHLPGNPYAVDTVLAALPDKLKNEVRPDLVISIGGALVSRMLKEYIREMEVESWTLGDTYLGVDCFKTLSRNIGIPPSAFFKALFRPMSNTYRNDPEAAAPLKEYQHRWEEIKTLQTDCKELFVDEADWSELKAFRYILRNIPAGYNLFLSNGTCVRYAQLFTKNIPHASYCNRGVSGIEGTNLTAAGCAMAYKGPTLLLSGDMSFAYSPGVMGLDGLPRSFKIIVVNNKGGGIFRFISPTRYIEHRDRFFCADPHLPLERLAEAYGWRYLKAGSEADLEREFKRLIDCESKAVLEIFSDEEYSASILRKYMRIGI